MNFTSNGIGRKNGYRFELHGSDWLHGEKMDKFWYLHCTYINNKQGIEIRTYTEHSHRFATREDAMKFCEDIADGRVSLAQIKEEEDRAYEAYRQKEGQKAKLELDSFLQLLQKHGVSPSILPEILHAYHDLSSEARDMFYDSNRMSEFQTQVPPQMTLGQWLNQHQQNIDVCLVCQQGEDYLCPAILYLDPEETAHGGPDYTDREKWLLSLPVEEVIGACILSPLVTVHTDFTRDQIVFLLNEGNFVSLEWSNLSLRAQYAGADFSARLAYLEKGKPFEIPFNGSSMDVVDASRRLEFCQILADHNDVFVALYPGDDFAYYAYTVGEDPARPGIITAGNEMAICMTPPGEGLTSTLDGKVYWAKHVGNKARAEEIAPSAPGAELSGKGM